jgi:light-regulated signal transduction histidine kinase (bacteriophytochrome)
MRGLDKKFVRRLFRQGINVEECFCGKCVIERRPVTMADCGQPAAYIDQELQFGNIRFLAAFPLTVQSRCLGMLCLFSHEGYEISERGWNLLQIISAEIALGMQNALLYQEVQQHAETLEEKVRQRTIQLEAANKELESFSYSVSHDLRSPLRGIDGWSHALLEDCFDQVNAQGKKHLDRIRSETQRMGKLIDGLLELSRVSRSEMKRERVDLSETARAIADHLRESEPGRRVEFIIEPSMTAQGDPRLLEIMLTNLLGNAWKFTGRHDSAVIEFGRMEKDGRSFWFVRDDGAGFGMEYARKLFGPFQRLHRSTEFPGNGIGLATVQRIVNRHGGRVWAEAKVEKGATFYFEL